MRIEGGKELKLLPLAKAKEKLNRLLALLLPELIVRPRPPYPKEETVQFWQGITPAGSVRRERPLIHDLDLVFLPHPDWGGNSISEIFHKFSDEDEKTPLPADGPKIKRFHFEGTQVDFYICDAKTFPVILLSRTGSPGFNRWICQLARNKGMKLHASGAGLESPAGSGKFLPVQEEAHIFQHLGLDWIDPIRRER